MIKNILLFLLSISFGFFSFYFQNVLQPRKLNEEATVRPQVITQRFTTENAPSNSLKGQFITTSGEIFFESRTATEPAQLQSVVVIQQGEKIVTKDTGNATIQFPSVVTVTIHPKTTLTITQTLPANIVFNQEGGSIEVKKEGTIPISIRVNHLLLEVIRGTIQLSVDEKKPIIVIAAQDGEATAAFNDSNNISTVIPIPSGKKYTYNDSTRTGVFRSL